MTIDEAIAELEARHKNVRFARLETIATTFFGEPRKRGTSHIVYKMPWPGDPRINIQKAKGGKAKGFQVKQVIAALETLKQMEESDA